jgi:hypothetical protein
MKLAVLKRRDRTAWLARVRDALERSRGVLEPAARSLQVRPHTLHRWLCEPELRAIPVTGRHWAVNDTHPAVRLKRAEDMIVDIDVGIVPLIEATWSMAPSSPETICSCEEWTNDGPERGKVQLGFNVAVAAWMWLHAVGACENWRLAHLAETDQCRFMRGDWSLYLGPLHGDVAAWVYFPRRELPDVTERLRRHPCFVESAGQS